MANTKACARCSDCLVSQICIAFSSGLTGDIDPKVQKTTLAIPAGEIFVLQGQPVTEAAVIRSGWAVKFTLLADGRRQIMDILLPGDPISAEELLVQNWTTSVRSLTAMEVCTFDAVSLLTAVEARADGVLSLIAMCTSYILRLRDLVAALGRQDAEARMARLVLTLHQRLVNIGLDPDAEMPFPLRQQDLADLLGLTQVHVSRVLRSMRQKEIFEVNIDRIQILDLPALHRASQS